MPENIRSLTTRGARIRENTRLDHFRDATKKATPKGGQLFENFE